MFLSLFHIIVLLHLCHGTLIRKVIYHEEALDTEKAVSSSLEEIPPIEQWLGVQEHLGASTQQNISSQDRQNTNDTLMQVSVRNRGKIGIQVKSNLGYNGRYQQTEETRTGRPDDNSKLSSAINSTFGQENLSVSQSGIEDFDSSAKNSTEDSPPPHDQVAKMARYIVKNSSK